MDETRRKELQAIGMRQGHGILVNHERTWPARVDRITWSELLDLLENHDKSDRLLDELARRNADLEAAVARSQAVKS